MNNILAINKDDCSGCGSCNNICPNSAIKMAEDSEGFLYPIIDENKCTNCGLCLKTCCCKKNDNKEIPECFAYQANDTVRINSSSGGAFAVIADSFINENAYISGAVYNDNLGVEHIVSSHKDEVNKMKGSKYLQSDIKFVYKEIKKLLENDKKVLFTGCPCQVAGLKAYLQKDYLNLYCIDIVCHGVCSPMIYRKYLKEEYLTDTDNKWISTNFRDKSEDWKNPKVTVYTSSDKYITAYKDDCYTRSFIKNLNLRKSCYKCKYSTLKRTGDITIGDFWGINEYNSNYDDGKGTSLILVNNNKGKYLSSILKNNSILFKKVPVKFAVKHNPNLIEPSKKHPKRKYFFDNINKMPLKSLIDFLIHDKCDVMILNYWYSVNYGASLTAFGVQCIFEKLGYKAKLINFIPKFSKKFTYKDSFAEDFANKYLHLTKECKNYNDIKNLNEKCNTFVSGSDQVFSPKIMKRHYKKVPKSLSLLDFVSSNNKKISFSACMGNFEETATYNDILLFNNYLRQFDFLSVRDDNSQNIIKNQFGLNTTLIVDAAFFIPKEYLYEMTKEYKFESNYVLYIKLPYNNNNWGRKIANKIADKLNYEIKSLDFDKKTLVEEWLASIKNAKFVVSDSYHAMIFSIIFNVPFIHINTKNVLCRFEAIYKLLGIDNRTINENDEVDYNLILKSFNWDEINVKIQLEIEKAESWLKKAMESENTDKSEYELVNSLFILLEENDIKYKNNLKLLSDKSKEFRKYYLYKVLSVLSIGELRKKYKSKFVKQKKKIKKIKKLLKKFKK